MTASAIKVAAPVSVMATPGGSMPAIRHIERVCQAGPAETQSFQVRLSRNMNHEHPILQLVELLQIFVADLRRRVNPGFCRMDSKAAASCV